MNAVFGAVLVGVKFSFDPQVMPNPLSRVLEAFDYLGFTVDEDRNRARRLLDLNWSSDNNLRRHDMAESG